MENKGGYEQINSDLVNALAGKNLSEPAKALGLKLREDGGVILPCLGKTYLAGKEGVWLEKGGSPPINLGSVLAGYLLTGGSGEPAHRFVPLDSLTEMVSSSNTYAKNSLESRLAKYAERDPENFRRSVELLGGKPGGEVGSSGESWIIEILPKIPAQLIFYPGDEEFPSETRLFFDITATHFLEFEFLAVLATIFVQELVAVFKNGSF